MDEREPPTSSSERDLQPALDGTSIAVDSSSAHLATVADLVAPGWARHADQSGPCRNDLLDGPSVVVYCGNEEEVSRGFLIALRAMGIAVVEQPPEPAKPAVCASNVVKAPVFHHLPFCVVLLAVRERSRQRDPRRTRTISHVHTHREDSALKGPVKLFE